MTSSKIFHRTVNARISSADMTRGASNSDFTVHLNNSQLRHDVFGFTCTHVSFQNQMNNINASNQDFTWYHKPGGIETKVITSIPSGWYTETDLLTAIVVEMNAVIAPTAIISASPVSANDERIRYAISNGYEIKFGSEQVDESTMSPYLGLPDGSDQTYFSIAFDSPFLTNLAGTQIVYLASSSLGHNMSMTGTGRSVDIIQAIPITSGFRGWQNFSNPNRIAPETVYSERRHIDDLDFQLLDQDLNVIQLGSTDLHIVIKFFV
jgi:hypothetical protein